ncbi:APH(3') family aminoglycoside O-phosphotransferase [Paraburkholderia oxyphila]|uniref:APH(3') family aminoglycoside O-phosphotransferase n=1 Tax=Paraburkholderia oxyphila TaxID=614212 RepID=UPI00047F7745|nr:APH(3') family aminoglycoside O-phosphotransferase [Paraburkholderia oxyphila]
MQIPIKWRERFAGALIERQVIGESGAEVFRIRCDDGKGLFLKSEPTGLPSQLPGEAERLRWMKRLDLPGPTVLDAATEDNRHWLLMTAVPGLDLANANHLSSSQIVGILAMALHVLHGVPIAACPFEHHLEERIAAARDRVNAGLVDEADFDNERQGQTAAEVLADLLSTLPETCDLVVTHGDACLPNFIVDGNHFTGFIDCGRLGVSDRYQDLALTARSITCNLGQAWVEPFFRAYGVEPDHRRIAFYCLLDEFF